MSYKIKKAAVLGSGVMGSGIACHFANVGIDVLMLDILPKDLEKNKINVKLLRQHKSQISNHKFLICSLSKTIFTNIINIMIHI